MVWISETLMPILRALFAITSMVAVFVLLPLAIFKKTRGFSSISLYIASFVFGINLWFYSLLITYEFWGVIGVVVGIVIVGVGVVPTAFLAIVFGGHWAYLTDFILLLAFTFGARSLGLYLTTKSQDGTSLKMEE